MNRSPVSQKTHHCITPLHVQCLKVLLWSRNLQNSSVWGIFQFTIDISIDHWLWQHWSARHRINSCATFEYRSFRKGDPPWGNLAGKFSVQSKAAWCDRNRHLVWAENLTSVVAWWGLGAWFVPPHAEFPRSFNSTSYFGPLHCSLSNNCRPCSCILVCIHYHTCSLYRICTNAQWQGKMWLHFLIQILVFVIFLF